MNKSTLIYGPSLKLASTPLQQAKRIETLLDFQMINQKKTANAIGGKTARACESCLKKRATWFCAADDAFLCGTCDSLVHSANELASRHKRVCLDTNLTTKPPPPPPSWHQGFTKKARTPRNKAKAIRSSDNNNYYSSQMPVVPEVGYEDNDHEDGLLVDNNQESDQMVFSVPNLDDDHAFENDHDKGVSFKGGFDDHQEDDISIAESEFNISLIGFDGVSGNNNKEWDINYLPAVGFPDNELAEFAADVESLLEQDEEEAATAKGGEEKDHYVCYPGVKLEEETGDIISTTTDHCCYFDWSLDVENEMFNFDLNNHSNDDCGLYDQYSQVSGVEVDEKVVVPKIEKNELNAPIKQANNNKESRILLRLNYEEVSNAWASQGCSSPWLTGRRPEFDPHHYDWPNSMDKFWQGDVCPTNTGADRRGEEWTTGVRGQVNGGDGGRSARVLRYREKRRTRLFSKKIRYEVRKLNAEKRPRLKGRFVKRTSLSPSPALGVNVNVNVNVGVESSFPYLHG